MSDDADVVLHLGSKHISRVAAVSLAGKFHKPVLGRGNDVLDRDAGIVDSVFTPNQVLGYKRTIYPGKHVIMQRVDLAEGGAHLAGLYHESLGQRSESKETFLEIDSYFSERDKEVGPCVRIDDRLHAQFRLMHLKRGRGIDGIVSGAGNEVSDHADIGIQSLGCGSACSTKPRL